MCSNERGPLDIKWDNLFGYPNHIWTQPEDELYDVPTCCMKFLNDFSWLWIEGIHHIQLENNLVEVKVQGAPNAMDYYFTSTVGCYSKLMRCKGITKLKA
jgi:hypothetical protein